MTHPDKLNGSKEKRVEFQRAWDGYKKADLKLATKRRCETCKTNRQMAERFLDNMKGIIQKVHEPLSPEDFIASIHYNKCYEKVLENDADKYMDRDLSMFADIRRLNCL